MSDHKTYKEYVDLRNDGRIVMYQRSDHSVRPKWNVRLKIPNSNGYVVKSTRTSDFEEGKRFSENLYYELEGRIRRGEQLKSPSFKRVISDWKKELPLVWRDKSPQYINGTISICENHLEPYFDNFKIDEITEDSIVEYFNHKIKTTTPPPSNVTLRHQGTVLGNILKFTKRKGFIPNVPNIPLPKLKINPRSDFNVKEWRKLYTFMRSWVGDVKHHRIKRDRFYTQQTILILGNTGVRVGELRKVRWVDIEEVKDIDGETRLSFTVDGKTGPRNVISNIGTERYFENLWNWRKEELGKEPELTEPILINDRTGKPIGSFKGSWETLMKQTNLLIDKDGNRRVPYSLRHTYVTMRLREGVNIYQLSNNIGSSVEMIESFYGKKRNKDPKNVSEITKTSFDPTTSKNTSEVPWR
jgi:integrase